MFQFNANEKQQEEAFLLPHKDKDNKYPLSNDINVKIKYIQNALSDMTVFKLVLKYRKPTETLRL